MVCTHPDAPFNESDHLCPKPADLPCVECELVRQSYLGHLIKPLWLIEKEEKERAA